MRLVLVGDIGWSDLYHLGDEAMTERALEALAVRGVRDVTLVAGSPEHAAARYGVRTVPRLGFKDRRRRGWNVARRDQVLQEVRTPGVLPASDPAHQVIEAVRAADAVLVAGGGNLTTFFAQHVFERTTLFAVARELGVPFALTSQTVGPLLSRADMDELRPMLAGAVAVGAREGATAALVSQVTSGSATVVRTMDDAFGLAPTAADEDAVARLGLPSWYLIASFTQNPSTPLVDQDAYLRLAARTTSELARVHDADVLLVPHAGNPGDGPGTRDQVTNDRIAQLADDVRVRPTPLLTARQVAALTARAGLVVGTRYHPAIIAARSAVPAVALAPTLYSSVRMRGAAANVGMPQHVLGLDSWRSGDLVRAATELRDDAVGVRQHLERVGAVRRAESDAWWDALVAALSTGSRVDAADLADVEPYLSPGSWPAAAGHLLDATERFDRERLLAAWERERLTERIARLEAARADTPAAPTAPRSPVERTGGRGLVRGALRSLRREAPVP
ncbi:hypothetical protein GCM10009809_05470 [Isoptericola hypogeus]|uniref:Polysaccharide pyruvyl transferase domain-containing protein n=1 Tax=Isoptericola hypogeus TaxID=300179 RepID=A0ABN2IUK3_9MICO